MTDKPLEPDPELLLFDLGDVLVEVEGVAELRACLAEQGLLPQQETA